jgi:hypothetical protein
MARNNRTPGAGQRTGALENVASQADNSRDTAPAPFLQAKRIERRFKISPAVASAIAALAYAVPEKLERRAW